MTRPSTASDGTEHTRLRMKSRRQSFAKAVDILNVDELACVGWLINERRDGICRDSAKFCPAQRE